MHAAELGATGGMFLVVMGLMALIKHLIPAPKKADDDDSRMDEIKVVVDKIFDMHARFDEDGTPLWYVPRSWSSTQDQIVETLRDIAETQRRTVDILERLERRE